MQKSVLFAIGILGMIGAAGAGMTPAVNAPNHAHVVVPFNAPQGSGVLYDQTDNAGTASTVSQDFEASLDTYDNQVADDFVVPAGETWTITSVDAAGTYFNGAGPADSFNVTFYADAAGKPGTAVISLTGLSYTDASGTGSPSITLSPAVILAPGTYWVSVQARLDFGTAGEWGWTDRTVDSNSAGVWQNPGDGFASGCVTWTTKQTCIPAATGNDSVFRLNGTSGSPASPIIGVSPASLGATQATDTTTTQTLTISNSGPGASSLDWSIGEANGNSLPAMPTSVRIPQAASENVGAAVSSAPSTPLHAGNRWVVPMAVLYDNGPLVTDAGAGAGGTDASAVQTAVGATLYGSNVSASAGFRVADDFTVPADGWTVDKITFFTYQTGSSTTSTIDGVNVRIWDGPPEAAGSTIVFGDVTTNRLSSTVFSGTYRVLDTGLTNADRPIMAVVADIGTTLPQGTYWVDWQISGSGSFSGPWAPPVTLAGAIGAPDANALQFDGSSWVPALDTTPNVQQDFPFVVEGSLGGGSGPDCSNPSDIPWLSVSPSSGSTPGSESTDVTVTFDSTGLADGSYDALLCVASNDPVTPLVEVPVSLTVGAANDGIFCDGFEDGEDGSCTP